MININQQIIEEFLKAEVDPTNAMPYVKSALLKALEDKDAKHKKEMKELIEDVPFQGRIEDSADFQNRLSEWKEEKLNQLK